MQVPFSFLDEPERVLSFGEQNIRELNQEPFNTIVADENEVKHWVQLAYFGIEIAWVTETMEVYLYIPYGNESADKIFELYDGLNLELPAGEAIPSVSFEQLI